MVDGLFSVPEPLYLGAGGRRGLSPPATASLHPLTVLTLLEYSSELKEGEREGEKQRERGERGRWRGRKGEKEREREEEERYGVTRASAYLMYLF